MSTIQTEHTTATHSPTVIVIGGGPAGVASGYYLQQAGIAYKIYEASDEIAHTWNSLYPSLRLNTSKWYSHMPGAPMPRHYPIFPTGKQYHAHVVDFAHQQGIHEHIVFNSPVERLYRREDGHWCVQTRHGTDVVPVVISATGRFCNPITPNIPGLQGSFEGQVVHAHDYLGPEPFVGQRVMIVGNGPTGVDLAPELGAQPDTPPVLLSMRTGVKLKPRYPLGLPKHAWMILAEHLPDALGDPLVDFVGDIEFRNLEEVGIRTPAPEEASTAAGTRGNELILATKAGEVICVPGPKRFFGRCVELTNGDRYELDTVILATGYAPVLYKHLEEEVQDVEHPVPWPVRDQSSYTPRLTEGAGYPSDSGREVTGLPGLYLVGIFYQGKGALYNINMEAKIAVDQIQERLTQRARVSV